jgi:hypothetical protein
VDEKLQIIKDITECNENTLKLINSKYVYGLCLRLHMEEYNYFVGGDTFLGLNCTNRHNNVIIYINRCSKKRTYSFHELVDNLELGENYTSHYNRGLVVDNLFVTLYNASIRVSLYEGIYYESIELRNWLKGKVLFKNTIDEFLYNLGEEFDGFTDVVSFYRYLYELVHIENFNSYNKKDSKNVRLY